MISDSSVYVWASPQGKIKGLGIKPLYRSVPEVVVQDSRFYEMLCLVDGLRIGKVREQELAALELKKRFHE